MLNKEVNKCIECPFVVYIYGMGHVGCSESEEITNMYIHHGHMPLEGIHELCPYINKEITIKFNVE